MALLIVAPLSVWAAGPAPPCAGTPLPAYAPIGQAPSVAIFHRSDITAWAPPACAHIKASQPAALVALAGRFAGPVDRDAMLARFGAISQQRGIRYWSVTDRAWLTLVTDATALSGPKPTLTRSDFTVDELKAGADLYFAEWDNRSSGPVIYRMRIRDLTPNSFVVETDNVTPVRYMMLQVYPVGDLRTVAYLECASDGAWNYYSLNEIISEPRWLPQSDKSFVNRAVAFFRLVAGIPTDREPPVAR